MFKFVIISAAMLMLQQFVSAQASDYKVVFDLTSNDPVAQQQVIRDAQVEVVLYGQGLDLVRKDKSTHTDDIANLIRNGVDFKACHIAMDRQHITESQLISGVQTVPDGIYEIISKQRMGFGYIKVAH